MDISIIVPVHNGGSQFMECLESIRAQPRVSLEVIRVDDASTDDSAAMARAAARKDRRVHLVQNPERVGAAESRNRGLGVARGRYVGFVDADDVLPPGSLDVLHRLSLDTGSPVVGGTVEVFGDDATDPLYVDDMPDRVRTTLASERDLWIPFWFQRYLFSASFLRTHEITFPDLTVGEDPVFLTHALTACTDVSLTSRCVYRYRLNTHPGNASGGRSAMNLRDWLEHVRQVQRLLCRAHPAVWDEVYGPFTKNIAGTWRIWYDDNPAPGGVPSAHLQEEIDVAAMEIWGAPVGGDSLRLDDWWPRNWTRISPEV